MRKVILLVLFFILASSFAFAENDYLTSGPVKKFKRGIVNVVTSPLEISKKVGKHWSDSGAHPAEKTMYLFGGTVKGLAYMVGRIGSGLWDICTLNLDIPAGGEPLMKPDYVWSE